MQERQAQEMLARQEKQRREMENYHDFRRKGLETARADQISKLIAGHEALIAATKTELGEEIKEFLEHNEELRKAFEANQAVERTALAGSS